MQRAAPTNLAVLLPVQRGPGQLGGPLALVVQALALLLQEQELLQGGRAGRGTRGSVHLRRTLFLYSDHPSGRAGGRCAPARAAARLLPPTPAPTLAPSATPCARSHLAINADEQDSLARVDPEAAEAADLGPADSSGEG